MKFKIEPLKEEISNIIFACLIIIFLPTIGFGILAAIDGNNELFILLIGWFVIACFISLILLGRIQWYLIDKEKIVVKNYLGVINEVYLCSLQQIVDVELPIVKRDHIRCFIFIDKTINIENKVYWGTTANTKFGFVRVPVTKELIKLLSDLNLSEKIVFPKKIF